MSMGKYVLNNIALRSWWLAPFACVEGIGEEQRRVRSLTKEEFNLLCMCDGEKDLEETDLLKSLLEKKFIRPAQEGEKTDSFLMHREYDNRCVPCMGINITERCNFNCIHCYEAVDNDIPRNEMSYEDCRRLLEEARDCGVQNVKITGGEPMIHKDFLKIIRCVYENEMTVDRINTNAFFLTEELVDEIKAMDPHILFNVSYDGAGYHDRIRGKKGAEKDLLKKIKILVDKGFNVRAAMTLNRINQDAVWETMKKMDELGVREFRIIRTSEVPRWVLNAGDACLSPKEYFDSMVELCRDYAGSDLGIVLNVWHLVKVIPQHHIYALAAERCDAKDYRPDFPLCANARENITVTPDGEVFPCTPSPGLFRAHGMQFGNVFKEGIREILQDSKYLSFVCRGVHAVRENDEKCGACPYFTRCTGGCRLFALGLGGDVFGHDPTSCLFFEGGYAEKIKEALPGYRKI